MSSKASLLSGVIGVLGLLGASTEARADAASGHEFSRWVTASMRVQVARSSLELDVPGAAQRLSIYFDVQLRHAFAAGEKWFATLADRYAPSLAVPDLSVLTVEPVKGIESSGYGWREDPIDGGGRFHKGADYKADRGTPVFAAGDGVVVFCGRQNGYGKVIYVDHGGGLITRYAHLREIGVHKGDIVVADTQIGEVGSTGRTTGPHLHFEVRIDGRAVDPGLALDVAEMQRTQPAGLVRLAAMALLPDAQKKKVDRHGPPKQRPERAGQSKRSRPTS